MENINILIHKSTRQVDLPKSVIGNDGENLQEKLVFSFDTFVNGTARLEIVKPNKEKSYLMLEKVEETYQIPVKSIITKTGRISMQLVITEGTDDEEIPIFKSNQFYMVVNSSIDAEIEEPEEYPEWIDVANTKLNEIDNLNITASKVDTTTTITITDREGNETSVEVEDGSQGERGIQGPQGPEGPAGADGRNGQDGRDGAIQYTAGDNITIINNTISANVPDVSGKLDTSKVKSSYSTTSGDVYDVTYINTMIGDIETLLSEV